MSAQAADVRAGSVEAAVRSLPVRAARLRDGTLAMGWAELHKLRHDHLDIFTRSVQPLLWLFIFGTALQHNHALSGGSGDYRAYLAPGVMAQAALFVAIFFGLGVIWERDVGQLQRLLATPLPRLGIVLGKATGAAIRALAQAVVLLDRADDALHAPVDRDPGDRDHDQQHDRLRERANRRAGRLAEHDPEPGQRGRQQALQLADVAFPRSRRGQRRSPRTTPPGPSRPARGRRDSRPSRPRARGCAAARCRR